MLGDRFPKAVTNQDFEKELRNLKEKDLLVILCLELSSLQAKLKDVSYLVEEQREG